MQVAMIILAFWLGFCVAVVLNLDLLLRLAPSKLVSKLHGKISPSTPSTSGDKNTAEEKTPLVPAHASHPDLLTKAQCENLPHEFWQRQAYGELVSILLGRDKGAKKFPCVYATAGYKHDEHRYVFMHSEDPTEPRNVRLLGNAMRAYLPQSHSLGPNTSLIIVYPSSDSKVSVDEYLQKFWDVLRGLRICDVEPWPGNIPTDTNAAKWAFCFDGVPWFPAAMTPAHRERKSRHAPNFTIAMQPKWVFDNLFNPPERRHAAVQAVRRLMSAYDMIDISPDLSAYGTEGTTEAHQYYLLDENKTAYCPYNDLDGRKNSENS